MEIFHPGQDRTYYFPCNRWLEKSKEAGAEGCRATLEPSEQPSGEDAGSVQYRVTVHTTDCRAAGTDSDISCVVYGELGDTGTQALDSSKDDFERGKVRGVRPRSHGSLTCLRLGTFDSTDGASRRRNIDGKDISVYSSYDAVNCAPDNNTIAT